MYEQLLTWLNTGVETVENAIGVLGRPISYIVDAEISAFQNGLVALTCIGLVLITLLGEWRARRRFNDAICWTRELAAVSKSAAEIITSQKAPKRYEVRRRGFLSVKRAWRRIYAASRRSIGSKTAPTEGFKPNKDAWKKAANQFIRDEIWRLYDITGPRKEPDPDGGDDESPMTPERLGWGELSTLLNYRRLTKNGYDFREFASLPHRVYSIGLFATFLLIIWGIQGNPDSREMVSIIVSKALISVVAILCAGLAARAVDSRDRLFEISRLELIDALARENRIGVAEQMTDVAVHNSDEDVRFGIDIGDQAKNLLKKMKKKPAEVDFARLNVVLAAIKDAQDQMETTSIGLGALPKTTSSIESKAADIRAELVDMHDSLKKLASALNGTSDDGRAPSDSSAG